MTIHELTPDWGPDKVLFDLHLDFGPGSTVPSELIALAIRVSGLPGDRTAVDLMSERIKVESWEERQALFDRAAEKSLAILKGISAFSIDDPRVEKRITLAFVPGNGTAGVHVSNKYVRAWAGAGLDLYINAWPATQLR